MILGSISQGDQQFCDVLLRKSRFETGNNQCFTSSKTPVIYLSRKSSKKLWWNKMQVKEKFKRLSAIHMYITLFCTLILLNNNKIPFKVLLVNEHCLECGNFSEAWLGKDSLLKSLFTLIPSVPSVDSITRISTSDMFTFKLLLFLVLASCVFFAFGRSIPRWGIELDESSNDDG